MYSPLKYKLSQKIPSKVKPKSKNALNSNSSDVTIFTLFKLSSLKTAFNKRLNDFFNR